MVPIIQPFSKLANSILPIDSNGILVLRDNAENVKRMLQMIDQVDVAVPAEYVSEVIPILYAQAEDIANALNSLGGTGGGSTVSIGGSSTGPGSTSGTRTTTGVNGASSGFGGSGNSSFGGQNGQNQNRTFGGATATGATAGTAFQQRIQSILQRAATGGGQQDQIQVFGQAKIIADQRANSLLVFATQADMTRIKEVVAKLDVLLSQVLIEAVIMDVTLGNTRNFGVSVAQNQTTVSKGVTTAGGVNNGQPFFNFLNSATTNLFPGNLTSTLPGGSGQSLSYFGNIGPSWDVAVQAAEQDSSATIIQRPRIQTSQAKEASFFVGQTVPYITSTYNNGVSGNSSSYSQLSVGVSLDVTPFINPDGLVVMDINQEIDDLGDAVLIDGNPVYKTTKRTLSSEIAVKDRDTIILGGFIRSDKSKSKSGIPFLQDIPLLGNLFTSRTDTKDRQELVVLMRPTVLKTPELAAAQVIKEENRLPGVSAAIRADAEEERRLTEAQLRYEQKQIKAQKKQTPDDPFFVPLPADMTNTAPTVP
jgi:general secretion pathway protein D